MFDKARIEEMASYWSEVFDGLWDVTMSDREFKAAKNIARELLIERYPDAQAVLNSTAPTRRAAGNANETAALLTATMGSRIRAANIERKKHQENHGLLSHQAVLPTTQTENGRGGRPTPGLVRYDSGASNVAQTMANMLQCVAPTPGDVIHFGNIHMLANLIGCTPQAIVGYITGNNGTRIPGFPYEFEIVSNSYTNYSARVIESAKRVEIIALEREMAELQARATALAERLSKLKK